MRGDDAPEELSIAESPGENRALVASRARWRTFIALGAIAVFVVGCGGAANEADAGPNPPADAATDAGVMADAAVAPDADTGPESYCSDGVIVPGEECDTGRLRSDTTPGACRLDCSDSVCGDEVVEGTEVCDTGDARSDTEPNACRMNCSDPSCGDGVLDAREVCDEGPPWQ